MRSLATFVAFISACAFAAADLQSELNNTNIDKRVLKRLTTLLESNKTLDRRDLAILNRTAHHLDIDENVVNRLLELVQKNWTDPFSVNDTSVTYDESGKKGDDNIGPVEQSPDYASSVVLASDLLSLTHAVANVKNEVCREQGYRFLDGLLMNKRWALKSEYSKIFQVLPASYIGENFA
ncbi:hypothetical protein O0L34_g18477 [Tuta absoluta]|nr:hypothetical protein O0L34_g18477 [Tuta absoluta]